jgi:hypothetical protein
MASGSYLDIPTTDVDVNRLSEESVHSVTPRSPRHGRSPSPSPRIRKKAPSHRGEAGIGSSVINLANTILGTSPLGMVANL